MEYSKKANLEPIPGYRLTEPLGQGGFGEVWKCIAPGGIQKAIKFVFGNLNVQDANRAMAQQEFNALQRVKGINHPYLLSMDRIEVLNGELLIVMELADSSLYELMMGYRQMGQPGVPREELLEYLCEVSEALDLMNLKHGLQHLDIKPGNLFLVSNHIKVADFGLVNDMVGVGPNAAAATAQLAGITPLYASPEAFMGRVSRFSDQYSLAIVYQESLTGMLPFDGKNARQLAMQHAMAPPNLEGLPESDRPIVAKALAKDPLQRYPSCLTFILALITGQVQPPAAASPDKLSAAKVIRCLKGGVAVSQAEIVLPGLGTIAGKLPFRSGLEMPGLSEPMPIAGPAASSAALPATAAGPQTDAVAAVVTGAEALPAGYRYLHDLGRTPMGDLWLVQAPNGNRRLVKAILDFSSQSPAAEAKAIAQLKRLRHPALVRLDFIQVEHGRLLVGMELIEETLAKRFEACRESGGAGIPRDELLGYLGQVAIALDELYEQTSIQHLALNPKSVLLTDDGVLISDFGILHLLGDSMGQPVANLNPRYSSPELAENRPSRSTDQYSLAVIYQEILTGTRPYRDQRVRLVAGGGRSAPGRRRSTELPPPDLSALPQSDRQIVARALERDPQRRFETCGEFIDALEIAGQAQRAPDWNLPALRQPEPPPPEAEMTEEETAPAPPTVTPPHGIKLPTAPTASDPVAAVAELVRAATGDWEILLLGKMRCLYKPGELLFHRCGASSYASGMAKGKLEGFAHEWKAELVRNQEDMVAYHVSLPSESFFGWGKRPILEVEIKLQRPRVQAARLTEVDVTFRPHDCKPQQAVTALTRVSRPLLESIRSYLTVALERRKSERLSYDQPVYITPVHADRSTDQPIQGQGKDIGLGGLGCYLPATLRFEQNVLVHLNSPRPDAGPINIPGQVVRSEACGSGWFEVGVKFSPPQPQGA